jgi:hypothetical protein
MFEIADENYRRVLIEEEQLHLNDVCVSSNGGPKPKIEFSSRQVLGSIVIQKGGSSEDRAL